MDFTLMGYSALTVGIVGIIIGLLGRYWLFKKGGLKQSAAGQKFMSVILVLSLIVTGVVLFVPDTTVSTPPTHSTTYQIELAEHTGYDFADHSENDYATGVTEIVITNDETPGETENSVVVTPAWTAPSGVGTSAPDGFAIKITAKRTDGGWMTPGSSTPVETTLSARVVGISAWQIEDANGTNEIVKIVERNTDGIPAIAWTDSAASTLVVEDAGNMNLYAAGESASFYLSVYLNEDHTAITFKDYIFSASIIIDDNYGTLITIPITCIITAAAS